LTRNVDLPFLAQLTAKDLRWTEWPKLQVCLEAGLTPKPDLPNDVLPTRVKELSSAISKDPTPQCRQSPDPQPPLPARVQD